MLGSLHRYLIVLLCAVALCGASVRQYKQHLLEHKAQLQQVLENIETAEQQLAELSTPYLQAEDNRQKIVEQEKKIAHDRELIQKVRWQFRIKK